MSGECWIWLGAVDGGGYGTIGVGSRLDGTRGTAKVHRVAYAEAFGEIEPMLDIHHSCGVKRCVRPDHLRAITRREHVMRHESPTSDNARKGRCEKCGSEREYMSGGRRCRRCRNEYMRALKARKRQADRRGMI